MSKVVRPRISSGAALRWCSRLWTGEAEPPMRIHNIAHDTRCVILVAAQAGLVVTMGCASAPSHSESLILANASAGAPTSRANAHAATLSAVDLAAAGDMSMVDA